MKKTRMELVCDDVIINKHSDGGQWGWANPIEVLPPVGSVISYKTFDQNHKEGEGVTSTYLVTGYVFTTEEDYNNLYRNQVCKVLLNSLS